MTFNLKGYQILFEESNTEEKLQIASYDNEIIYINERGYEFNGINLIERINTMKHQIGLLSINNKSLIYSISKRLEYLEYVYSKMIPYERDLKINIILRDPNYDNLLHLAC